MVFGRVGGFIERYHLYRPKYDERQENHTKMVSGSVSCGNRLKHTKICVTRDLNVDRKRSNNCILTDFEKLLYRSQSFAQTNFYSNIENIFSKFNHQKLNPFEGLAHGEN